MTDHDKTRRLMDEVAHKIIRLDNIGRLARISTSRINVELANQAFNWLRLPMRYYGVGSVFKGFPNTAISDGDFMVYKTTFPIVLWKSQEKESGAFVIAEQDLMHPVYLRLKEVDKQCLDPDFRSIINRNGYLKNSDFIKVTYLNLYNLNNKDNVDFNVEMQQGPSIVGEISCPFEGTCPSDSVPCLKCQSWPPFIGDFFIRKRLNNWPSQNLLDKVKGLECHVVPVGYSGSKSYDIEWRLSFSIAEGELIKEMYEPYYECMLALKSIKKKYIKYSDSDKPTPFCSYFIKTTCLWMCETFPHTDYSVMDLIRKILDWLIDCYQQNYLPHYFMPQHNLIGHLSRECCDSVRETLTAVKRNLWTKVLLSVGSGSCSGRFTLNIICDKCELNVTRDNGDDGYSTLQTTLFFHPQATETLEEVCLFLSSQFSLKTELKMFKYPAYKYSLCTHAYAETLQKYPLKTFRFPEEVILQVVENIKEIVPKGYREMYKTSLYRYLGDVYTHLLVCLSKICSRNRGHDGALAVYQNAPLHYYGLGAKMVFPDNCSDYGIGGQVLVVKYHYIMGNYKEMKQMFDSILLNSCLGEESFRLASIQITKSEPNTTAEMYGAWDIDGIFLYLVKCSDKKEIFCHPIILILYLKARVLLIEGDTENALNIVKKIKEYQGIIKYSFLYDECTNMFITIIESLVGLLGVIRIFNLSTENSL